MVLHFDEIQAMLWRGAEGHDGRVEHHSPPSPCSPDEYMRYLLVWFSEALRTTLENLRFGAD